MMYTPFVDCGMLGFSYGTKLHVWVYGKMCKHVDVLIFTGTELSFMASRWLDANSSGFLCTPAVYVQKKDFITFHIVFHTCMAVQYFFFIS